MTRILLIDSSPNPGSASQALAEEFAAALGPAQVTRRHVGAPLPALDQATIGAFYTAEAERSDAQRALVALSDALVAELEAADLVVIGAPMHNFGISAGLKSWIDQVARVGRTFRYGAHGPEGLLKGKTAIVVAASGGRYGPETGLAHMDHLVPHLQTVLRFIGIEDIEIVRAEGMARPGASLDAPRARLADLAARLTARKAA